METEVSKKEHLSRKEKRQCWEAAKISKYEELKDYYLYALSAKESNTEGDGMYLAPENRVAIW